MKSNLLFVLALVLALFWIGAFTYTTTYWAVHIIAILAIVFLIASFFTRNKKN